MSIIYLDNAATTRCINEVKLEMIKYFQEEFGNPSSQHVMGKRAKHAVNQAAYRVSNMIGAHPDEIVFTSGATESNNLAVLGVFDFNEKSPINAVFSPIDHKSKLDVASELSRRGILVKYLDVGSNGIISLDSIKRSLDENTRIISIGYVNSEIGTIQNIEKISKVCETFNVILHVDAVQAIGKIPIDVKNLGIDTMSISAHKIFGPKGIGALYVNSNINKQLRPIIFGGGQSRLRSGTLPTPLIVGLGLACEYAQQNLVSHNSIITELRNSFLNQLKEKVDFVINTDLNVSVPHIFNIQIPGINSEILVTGLRDVAISSGAACNSDSLEPSYILTGIGLAKEEANNSIRISFSPFLTKEDIDKAVHKLSEKINNIKSVSSSIV